jgi:hypothetical protein
VKRVPRDLVEQRIPHCLRRAASDALFSITCAFVGASRLSKRLTA